MEISFNSECVFNDEAFHLWKILLSKTQNPNLNFNIFLVYLSANEPVFQLVWRLGENIH